MTALANAPAHWTRTTIGEIADVRLGRQRSPKDHAGDQMRPYLRAANINWYSLRLKDVAEMNFTDDEMQRYALAAGDILVVEGSGSASEVGKCVVVPDGYEGHGFQNHLIRLRPNEGIDPRWLMYRVNAEAELGGFLRLARGIGILHLGSTRAAKWPVAVPPLDEQKRMVSEIERLLVRESLLQGYASSVGSGIDRLRRKILHDLTRGPEKPLGELATTASGGTPSSGVGAYYDGDIPWLNSGELADGVVRGTGRTITHAGYDKSSAKWVEPGALLVAMYGATIGKLGVAGIRLTTNQAIAAITPDPDVLRTRFLFYRLLADRQRLIHNGKGGAQKNISQSLLRAWPVPLLSLAEQDARSEQLDTHVSRLSATSAAVAAIPARGVLLRRSILKAAFEGRL